MSGTSEAGRRIEYDKLVRDRIPDVIAAEGKRCEVRVLGEEEYQERLLTKLQEEAAEATASGGDIGELADVLEVVYALLAHQGVTVEELERVRQEKHDQRGGFSRRLLLLAVEEF